MIRSFLGLMMEIYEYGVSVARFCPIWMDEV